MDIKEVILPKPKFVAVFLVFLNTALISLSFLCIDALIIWVVWSSVVVPEFGLVKLGIFQILAIVIGLNALVKALKGV